MHDALRGDGGGGVTSFTLEKTNDEVLSLFRPCFVSRSEKKITAIKNDYLIQANLKNNTQSSNDESGELLPGTLLKIRS